ncbi:YcnI family protein [Myceligenerans crystallogenes]|uniref:YncI copper-binding domain-containing protein n=1 Tax=Myceligenerans crystallogenes TaxID=316335 RepID=A0ABN2NB94_9MICO
MRTSLRALGATVLATGLVLAGATAASAHVTVTPSGTAAGSYALLTFAVPHGCEGSGTTKVSIQMPEQIIAVTPSVNPSWDVENVMEELPEPVEDGHGGEYTERVAEVVYTAHDPLPDGLRDAFELSLKLPETEGETLAFPVVQECEEGETAWVQPTQEGAAEPEYPAPYFALTAAEGGAHGTVAEPAGQEVADEASGAAAASTTAGSPALTWIALALGAAGFLLGLVAFLKTRRARD